MYDLTYLALLLGSKQCAAILNDLKKFTTQKGFEV